MKFIFPKNYNFKNKLFGIIDYPTAIFNVIVLFEDYSLFNLMFAHNLFLKILFIIVFYLPIFLLSILGFNHENFLYISFYIFKYLLKSKLYLYK